MKSYLSAPKRKRVSLLCAVLLGGVLLAALLTFCFYGLGAVPIADWDEARHGVSAYEMMQNREWIVTTYRGSPDYWNLKPPLSEWMICLFFALFGYTRTAFRAYSALSMFLCGVLMMVWGWKRTGKIGALFSVLALIGMQSVWIMHCARTGDADSLFILLCTASTLSLADACSGRPFRLVISCLCISLAFLTKSFHAGFLLAEMLAALLIMKKRQHFDRSVLLLSLAALILPVFVWAAFRVSRDGFQFLAEMVRTDVLHRASAEGEEFGHFNLPLSYYPKILLADYGVIGCITMIPAGIALRQKMSETDAVLATAAAVPLLLYSLFKTKMEWYVYPLLPALAVFAGRGAQLAWEVSRRRKVACIALLLPVCILILSVRVNASIIRQQVNTIDRVQVAIDSCLNRNDETEGLPVYLDLTEAESETWPQAYTLAALLAGNNLARDGSVEDWKKGEVALLLTTSDRVADGYIIREWEDYCLLLNKLSDHSQPFGQR